MRPLVVLSSFALAIVLFSPAASQDQFQSAELPVENGVLYYETIGHGPPLVFIHGGQMDRRMWDPQMDAFRQTFQIIRYDVRGYGKSSLPEKPYANVDDLFTLLNHLKIKKAALVGLSLGGVIAIDFTLVHPEMVDRLILSGPGLGGYQESADVDARIWAMIISARDSGTESAARLWMKDPYMIPAMENALCRDKIRQIVSDNAHCWLNNPIVERGIKPPAIQRLHDIKAPTLLIVGERDVPDISAIADTLEKSIPGLKRVALKGAGHIANMENPDDFNSAVGEFLKN